MTWQFAMDNFVELLMQLPTFKAQLFMSTQCSHLLFPGKFNHFWCTVTKGTLINDVVNISHQTLLKRCTYQMHIWQLESKATSCYHLHWPSLFNQFVIFNEKRPTVQIDKLLKYIQTFKYFDWLISSWDRLDSGELSTGQNFPKTSQFWMEALSAFRNVGKLWVLLLGNNLGSS